MRQVIANIALVIFSILSESCNTPKLTQDDIIGSWKSSEGALLVLNQDGTFTGKFIPAEFGFFPPDSFRNIKFNGSGKWALKKGASNWEVNMNFDKVTGIDKNGCSFPLLVAGENGLLDNKPPWYLFVWYDEEGGARYKFTRSN